MRRRITFLAYFAAVFAMLAASAFAQEPAATEAQPAIAPAPLAAEFDPMAATNAYLAESAGG